MIGDGGNIGPWCMGDGDISRFCSRDIDIFIPGTQRADDVEFRECCEALRLVEPLVRTARMRSPSCSTTLRDPTLWGHSVFQSPRPQAGKGALMQVQS